MTGIDTKIQRKIFIYLLFQFGGISASLCQVVLDGSFGTSGSITGPNYDITENLGKTVGNSLFHSFSQFDLINGDVATFSGTANIQNVLSRVTGGSASSIDGTIVSTIGDANLFFINPSGVIFGPNAQVDISGSFVVSTADSVRLNDGIEFVASDPMPADDQLLTTAPPNAFGFLGPTVNEISVNGSQLSVSDGESISLIGGGIQIKDGQIISHAGQVNLVSARSDGTVDIIGGNAPIGVDTTKLIQLGDVTLNNSKLDVTGARGGRIVVHTQNITLDDSSVESNTEGVFDGLGIEILARENLILNHISTISSDTQGDGIGGNIDIKVQGLELQSASSITADRESTGGGGNIMIEASNISIEGTGSGIYARNVPGSMAGQSGDITITTIYLAVSEGGQISVSTSSMGDGGEIDITSESIIIDGKEVLDTGILAEVAEFADGNGGNITIKTANLDIANFARVSAGSAGSGNGGNIDIQSNAIQIDGGNFIRRTGIFVSSQKSGKTGNISITPYLDSDLTIELVNRGFISGTSDGIRSGGNIRIIADTLSLSNNSGITVENKRGGIGGDIEIKVQNINVESRSSITADTTGRGPGGTIDIQASTIRLDGIRKDGAVDPLVAIQARRRLEDNGAAASGNIQIQPLDSNGLSIELINGANITTSAQGNSPGGTISITATSLKLENQADIKSTSEDALAGNILIAVMENLTLVRNSKITVISTMSNAGSISIGAGKNIQLIDNSTITAEALKGTGGDINLQVPIVFKNGVPVKSKGDSIVYLQNSTLTAQAKQNGGNITIDPQFIILNNSTVTANAELGSGGALNLISDFLFISQSSISADSQFGTAGDVVIDSTDVDLSGSLAALPDTLLSVDSQLLPHCGIRLPVGVSSFLLVGQGGIPRQPNRPTPVFDFELTTN